MGQVLGKICEESSKSCIETSNTDVIIICCVKTTSEKSKDSVDGVFHKYFSCIKCCQEI